MTKKNFIYFLFSLIFIMSCNKQDTETIKKDYKKITIVRTIPDFSSAVDSLIIELNNDSTIKSIKTYAFGIGKTFREQIIKNFIYQTNSIIPDSSVIETKNWMGITNNFTEKYLYENGKIVNVYSRNSLVTYTYNQDGKIIYEFTTYKYHQDTLYSNFKFEYNGNNIYSAIDQDSNSLSLPYENKYINFDDKINPLNELFKKCNFPFNHDINSLLPPEYLYSENNPTKMEVGRLNINQTYKYNQFNYPVEVISNWANYNVRIYYE